MRILEQTLDRELAELHKNGVQLRHIGRLEGIAESLKQRVRQAIELTRNNDRIILNVAFNYGGRAEILDFGTAINMYSTAGNPVAWTAFCRHNARFHPQRSVRGY